MVEFELYASFVKLASRLGARLFRQNTGVAWASNKIERGNGRLVRLGPGDVLLRNARPFHSGFEGWSDLGGWSPLVVTPDMVGLTVAVYTQIEVKKRAAVSDEQQKWIDAVNKSGGRAGVARSDDDVTKIINAPIGKK